MKKSKGKVYFIWLRSPIAMELSFVCSADSIHRHLCMIDVKCMF